MIFAKCYRILTKLLEAFSAKYRASSDNYKCRNLLLGCKARHRSLSLLKSLSMRNYNKLIVVLGLAFLGCKTNTQTSNTNEVTMAIMPKSGSSVSGIASFKESGNKVRFDATFSGLKPGLHAIHIHEKSDCSAPDASSAGGHWNPTFKNHGKWGSVAYHRGDIGNFTADASGKGKISMSTDEWCIGCGDPLKDILNKSIIVHEGADDFVTQPTGNAGGRLACSAIIK